MVQSKKSDIFNSLTPPAIPQHPVIRHWHDTVLTDPYHWLRADNWRDVLKNPDSLPEHIRTLIDAENIYADRVLAKTRTLQKALQAELKARMEPDDADVPMPDGEYCYYSRFRDEGQHALYCRSPRNDSTREEILLDGDQLAKGRAFLT